MEAASSHLSPPAADERDVTPLLIDEYSKPGFRETYGSLITGASELRIALTHLRLTTLDLTRQELAAVRSIRLLLARVSGADLDLEAHHVMLEPDRAHPLRYLIELLLAGIVEIRSAPLGGWSPDYTVFSRGGTPSAVVLGFHAFERPHPHRGPSFAAVHGPGAAKLGALRFDNAWDRAHDISPAIRGILGRRTRLAPGQPRSPTIRAAAPDGSVAASRRGDESVPDPRPHAPPRAPETVDATHALG